MDLLKCIERWHTNNVCCQIVKWYVYVTLIVYCGFLEFLNFKNDKIHCWSILLLQVSC